jgi:hypothetical protein
MNEITKDQKIQLLERFLRAVVGRPETEIIYKNYSLDFSFPKIVMECDVDNVIKIMSDLSMGGNIDTSFYTLGAKKVKDWFKNRGEKWEGCTEVEFLFEPQYWRDVERLEKENKELKERLRKQNETK